MNLSFEKNQFSLTGITQSEFLNLKNSKASDQNYVPQGSKFSGHHRAFSKFRKQNFTS